MRYSAVWPIYARQWDAMVINTTRRQEFERLGHYAIAHKTEYLRVEDATGVPWAMIAVIHRREGDGNFGTYLGNGQSLSHTTTITPRGRGPFRNFLGGAIDALRVDDLTNIKDWRLEKQLYWMTSFNGWAKVYGTRSPYIWGGTSVQVRGKFIRDGVYDPNEWDTQPGCAPLLDEIAKLDPTVKLVRETPLGQDLPPVPSPVGTPQVHSPMSPLERWLTSVPPPPATEPDVVPDMTTAPSTHSALTPAETATIHSGVHNLIKRDMSALIASVVPSMFQSMATSYVENLATQCADDITKFVGDQFK